MALYIPAGRRRRRLIIVGVVAAVVGLTLGAVLGRASAPTTGDAVSSVRADARSIDARLQALPNEFEKVLSGDPQYANGGGPAESLTAIEADTAALARRAEWLSDDQRTAVAAAVARAQVVAEDRASASDFQTAIDDASTAIEQTFGLPVGTPATTPTTQGP
ncbi:MAG: hypothetical protein ACXWB2_16350 [Acidimicrobiales bacterium]